MHLIERYALSCGVKIGEPYIYDKFFPLAINRYITIHTSTKNSKNYDYWQEVIDILLPVLQRANITIVQVGSKENRPLNFVYQTVGQTNINQTAYIIRNSLLHLGADSFPVHFASAYNIPIVALYSNTYANCVKPYWGDSTKQILIEPNRKGLKPSFSFEENPKVINAISPEDVAKNVCNLLGLDFTYNYKTVFVGHQFGNILLEVVPDPKEQPITINSDTILIRMDFVFDENVLAHYLSRFKCAIVTDKPISPQILVQFKNKILEIHYNLTKEHNSQFVYFLQTLGIKCSLHSYLSEREIEALKVSYMDFGLIYRFQSEIPEIIIGKNNLFYKSSKFTSVGTKVFPSYYAYLNNLPIGGICDHLCPLPTPDNQFYNVFWKEQQHIRIVERI